METNAAAESTATKAYRVRWLVLLVAVINRMQRSFCQSCFGQINNVLVKILHVEPWQIDWLVVVQSIFFILLSIPVALIANRAGFRNSMLGMNALQCLAFSLLVVGLNVKGGYYLMLACQSLNGCDTLIGVGITPLLGGSWFPSNEVASAVSIQLFARGAGEALGSVLTPLIVNIHQANDVIIFRLTMLFVPFLVLPVISFLITYKFISDSPPLPPSVAQMKKKNANANKERLQTMESLKKNCTTLKNLLLHKRFLVVAAVMAFLAPVLRSYTILLSSMLHREYPFASGLNQVSGNILLIAWILYTVAALLTGTTITRLKKYRAIAAIGAFAECVAGILIFTGLWTKLHILIYTGVILSGASTAIIETSLFELIAEVTYPKPFFLVTSIYLVLVGSVRFIYPVIGRALLTKYGAAASTAPQVVLITIAFILIVSVPIHFKRLEADTSSETTPLIDD